MREFVDVGTQLLALLWGEDRDLRKINAEGARMVEDIFETEVLERFDVLILDEEDCFARNSDFVPLLELCLLFTVFQLQGKHAQPPRVTLCNLDEVRQNTVQSVLEVLSVTHVDQNNHIFVVLDAIVEFVAEGLKRHSLAGDDHGRLSCCFDALIMIELVAAHSE